MNAHPSEPLLVVEWHRVLFLHFAVEPHIVRAQLPPPFELELYQGKAVVSLVALTMHRFRPVPSAPLWTKLLWLLREQRMFNVRTYVRHRGEPGAFFFWSWLSRPWGLPLPDRPLGLSCAFAKSRSEQRDESGDLPGVVENAKAAMRFAYEARIDPLAVFAPCSPSSLAEFALERYTGYFWHRGGSRIFRAWHLPWMQSEANVTIKDNSLIIGAFPWFQTARFIRAHYAPGFPEVQIGRPVWLDPRARANRTHHHGASGFFEMP